MRWLGLNKLFVRSPKQKLLDDLTEELRNSKKEYQEALQEAKAATKIIEARRRLKTLKDEINEAEDAVDDEVCPHGFTDEEDCKDCDTSDDLGEGPSDDIEGEIKKILLAPLLEKARLARSGSVGTPDPVNVPGEMSATKKKAIEMIKNASDDDIRKFF